MKYKKISLKLNMSNFNSISNLENKDLPTNIAIERSILGAILSQNTSYDKVSDIISAEDFFEKAHQELYRIIQTKLESAHVADLLTLSGSMKAVGIDYDYVKKLAETLYPYEHIRQYAEILVELSTRRKLIFLGKNLIQDGYSEKIPADEQLQRAEKFFFEMHSKSNHNKTIKFFEGAKQVLNTTYSIVKNEQSIIGLKSHFFEIDHLLGGFKPGELIILAARPSTGKTALAANICCNIANDKKRHAPVLFVSLEMPYEQICFRMISSLSGIPLNSLLNAKMQPRAVKECIESMENFKKMPFYIYDTSFLSPGGLRSLIRQMKRQLHIELVVVDYLQLMESGKKDESREQEISKISRSLKLIAKEIGIPVIALSQMSRDIEKRTKEAAEPKLSDLRGSGSIEQDADVIMFLFREDDTIKLSVAKNRNGALGIVPLKYISEITTFKNF